MPHIKNRGKGRTDGHINLPNVSDNIPHQKKNPLFSFNHVDKEYCISKCNKEEKAALIDQLHKLSSITWQDINNAHRHGLGYEVIARNSIKGKFPEHIKHDESVKILAFRFSGKKPMVGYRQENIFYIIWLDRSYTLYDHG